MSNLTRNTKRQRAVTKLEAHGYVFNISSNADRLEQLVDRAERGLISYEKRTIAELRQFYAARKLSILNKSTGKSQLIVVLETADDNARFEGFSELPAELRVWIYERHFQHAYDSSKLVGPPGEPPITKASRLLRKESLPVFYDTVRIPIATHLPSYMTAAVMRNAMGISSSHASAEISKSQARKFFQAKVPNALVSNFKKISIDGWILTIPHTMYLGHWAWEIDLAGKGKTAVIRCASRPSAPGYTGLANFTRRVETQHDRMKERFHGILDNVSVREGVMQLTRENIVAFAGVLDRIRVEP